MAPLLASGCHAPDTMIQPKPYNPPAADALITVYADEAMVVADKPSGLLSVPGRGPEKAVCANSLLSARHGPVLTVHRLDMDTSGVMVFARSKDIQRQLSSQFEQRTVDKTYEALVHGEVLEDSGTIDAAIAKFSRQRPLRHLDPEGRPAITHWQVTERSAQTTRLLLKPETGRSHQLRLHLASIGHPILGDVFYGDPASHARLCLHAKTLSLTHPITGEWTEFKTKTPF
ncbi:MAG: RluA family pseudouridine synthase [Hyphomonadaceae bacterium]|nr:RluA family pseudouridine synthase [Hyphomonadaceae bacterium]